MHEIIFFSCAAYAAPLRAESQKITHHERRVARAQIWTLLAQFRNQLAHCLMAAERLHLAVIV